LTTLDLLRKTSTLAYLGKSDTFDKAIAAFAETYADQNDRLRGAEGGSRGGSDRGCAADRDRVGSFSHSIRIERV
jgi:hypothetical protein